LQIGIAVQSIGQVRWENFAGRRILFRLFREVQSRAQMPSMRTKPDAARGKTLYATQCAACHGANGQGTLRASNTFVFPPLWGPKSFNTGAGTARVSIATAFVQAKMPLGNAGSLTDQDAYDIAAYFTAQPQPAFAGTSKDWPKAGKPADARVIRSTRTKMVTAARASAAPICQSEE
jgi:cytochrome c